MAKVDVLAESVASVVDWRLLGACRVRDTAQFFEAEGEGASRDQAPRAARQGPVPAVSGACGVRRARTVTS